MTNKDVRIVRLILFGLLLALLFAGCAAAAPSVMDEGRLEGRVYSNEYLGCELELPEGWNAVVGESESETDPAFLDFIELELPPNGKFSLLSASQNEGEGVAALPEIVMLVRQTRPIAGYVPDAKAYLETMSVLLEQNYADCFFDQIAENRIGGRSFCSLSMQLENNEGDVTYHTALTSQKDDYLLIIGVSYLDFSQQEDAFAVLETLKFR